VYGVSGGGGYDSRCGLPHVHYIVKSKRFQWNGTCELQQKTQCDSEDMSIDFLHNLKTALFRRKTK